MAWTKRSRALVAATIPGENRGASEGWDEEFATFGGEGDTARNPEESALGVGRTSL
jgi:hypothetical protein